MQHVNVLEGAETPLFQIDLDSIERFALSHEPVALQIQVHIQNARVILDPKTQNTTEYTVTQVLEYMEYIIEFGPDALDAYLGHEDRQLLGFRCAQVIDFYGVEAVVDYIELVYGRNMVVFAKEQANEQLA